MGSQRRKIAEQKRQREWDLWIEEHRKALRSIGLPPEVYLDLQHWEDFLENGSLHWHSGDSAGFEFWQLSPAQMHRLLHFLEEKNPFEPQYYPLPGWLRARLGLDPA